MAGRVRNDMAYAFGDQAGKVSVPKSSRKKSGKITPEQWLKQVQMLPGRIEMKTQDFLVAIKSRAYRVFQTSFKYKQFHSSPAIKWAPITDSTWKSRQRHLKKYGKSPGIGKEIGKMDYSGDTPKWQGTGRYKSAKTKRENILQEFGFLKQSLTPGEISKSEGYISANVYVDRKTVLKSHIHRAANGEWAAWHNNPGPNRRYGHTGVVFKKRQFMGHSSYIVGPNGFIDKNESRYLFDAVFDGTITNE